MTIKHRLFAAAAVGPLFTSNLLLRGAQVTFSPDTDAGADVMEDDPFAEQPGDREPEPEDAAADPDPAPEPEGDDGDAGGGDEGEGDESENATDGEGGTEGAAEGEGEGEEQDEPAPRKTDWRDRQIVRARQKAKEADEARIAAEKKAAALEALYGNPDGEGGDAPTTELVTREEAVRIAKEELRTENEQKALGEKLDGLFSAGERAFPKSWQKRIDESGGALSDELRANPGFLEAVADLPNGAQVYHEIAGDLDRMEELLKMPPVKLGMELAQISAKVAVPKPKPISRVPAPIRPLDKPTMEELPLDDERISQEEFNRRMDAMEEASAKKKRR